MTTAELERDRNMILEQDFDIMAGILSYHVGEDNAISRKELLRQFRQRHNLTDRQIRLLINQMRKDGEPICSRGGRNGGYWIARNYSELEAFIEGELRSRAYDMLETAKKMENAGRLLFSGGEQWRLI